jgi:purine-binding chemotaxis protein CheW
MKHLFLIAHLGGARVGIESGAVESIVHVPEIVPVPMCDPSVAGIFALRSRVLTLIDTQILITSIPQNAGKGALAVVTEIAGHQYGLLVDKVDDVVAITEDQMETKITPSAAWAPYVNNIATTDGELIMILDIDALVAGCSRVAE